MKKTLMNHLKNTSILGTLITNGKTMWAGLSITPWERTKKRSASIGSKSYTALLAATLLIHGQDGLCSVRTDAIANFWGGTGGTLDIHQSVSSLNIYKDNDVVDLRTSWSNANPTTTGLGFRWKKLGSNYTYNPRLTNWKNSTPYTDSSNNYTTYDSWSGMAWEFNNLSGMLIHAYVIEYGANGTDATCCIDSVNNAFQSRGYSFKIKLKTATNYSKPSDFMELLDITSLSIQQYAFLPDGFKCFFNSPGTIQTPTINFYQTSNLANLTCNNTVYGTADAGATIELRRNSPDELLGTTTAASDNTWSFTFTTDGIYSSIYAKSKLGSLTSASSTAITFTLSTTPQAKPTIQPLAHSSGNTIPTLSGHIDTTPFTFIYPTGNGSYASVDIAPKLFLYDGNTQLKELTYDAQGNWSWLLTTLAQGQHTFKVVAKNYPGNTADSDTVTYTYDSVAPAAPIIINSPQYISLNMPTVISGTAEAGSTVAIYANNSTTAMGSANTNSNGQWSIMLPNSMILSNEVQPIYAQVTDAAGNTSTLSTNLSFSKAITADSMATALLNNDAFITKIAQDLSTTIVNNVGGNVTFVNSLEGIFKNDANTINTLLDGLAANAVTYAALYNALLSRGSAVNNLKAAFDDGVTSSSSPNATYDTIMTAIQSKINEAQ